LIKNASEDFVERLQDESSMVSQYAHFDYFEEGADKGAGVKKISKEIMEILKDERLLEEERERAKKLRQKISSTKFGSIDSSGGGNPEFNSYFSSASGGGSTYAGFGSGGKPQGRSAFGSGKDYDEEDDSPRKYGKEDQEENYNSSSLARKLGLKENEEKKKNTEAEDDDFGDFEGADEDPKHKKVVDLLGDSDDAPKPTEAPKQNKFSLPKPPKATGASAAGSTDLCKF
jgi:ENTH domain